MMQLIDTHAHLDEIVNLDQALTEARAANIVAVVAVGSDYNSNQRVLQIAEMYPGLVYPALGIHPAHINDFEIARSLDFIQVNIDRAIAIGEIGLDYHKRVRAIADKELQKSVLSELLAIARKYGKPAIIHSRYAWRDALTATEQAEIGKAVFHWYTGTSSVLRDIIRQGYFVSATPAAEYHEEHRRAVRETPLEKLLLETDTPVVYGRGREFEYESRPADIRRALLAAAKIKGVSQARIADITTTNAANLFHL